MKKTIIFATTFAFASLMTSCEDSDEVVDITAPEVTEFELFAGVHEHHEDEHEEEGEHDHEHITFHAGETITLEFAAADESLIKSWKLNIHYGEGHSHNHREASTPVEWNQDFSSEITPATTVEEIYDQIVVPENVAEGEYHAVLYVFDEHGNEAKEYKTIEIHGDHDHEEEAH